MLSADCFFALGSSHRVCQDYAVASPQGDYVILSDGCSSVPDTDIGARLLVKAAQAYIGLENSQALLAHAVARAEACTRALGLSRSCLAATLLVARKQENVIQTLVAGDGVIMARRRQDGAIFIYAYTCEPNAPFYLYYTLDDELRDLHRGRFGDARKGMFTHYSDAKTSTREWTESSDFTVGPSFPLADFDLTALVSDGAASVSSSCGPVPLEEIVREFVSFKTLKGEFVRRRLRRAFELFRQRGWTCFDDISVAVIADTRERCS